MRQLSDIEFLPIAGFTSGIIWFLLVPCHNTMLDVLIYNIAGFCMILSPLVVFMYKRKEVEKNGLH